MLAIKRRPSIPTSIFLLFALLTVSTAAFSSTAQPLAAGVHTLGSTDSIDRIGVEVVYYLPKDRSPLPDWKERIDYLMQRAQKFHRREFTGQSDFVYDIYPEPFVASATQAAFPKDDPNNFFWTVMNEVWHSGKLHFKTNAFPIILVFSENNFSPSYDDWSRECNGVGCLFPEPHSNCAGYVNDRGEDRPGSRCGGSRAVFWPQKHIGLGLVTADGWKVPMIGSDCVVYHEGIGHSIGLPHPEPINNSVMGLAQYAGCIHQTWIDNDQKEALGWKYAPVDQTDLFSTFQVGHSPRKPIADDPVQIVASFPERYLPATIQAEYQTNLYAPFNRIEANVFWQKDDVYNVIWTLPPVEKGQSVAYRVSIETDSGDRESIWNYYKVR